MMDRIVPGGVARRPARRAARRDRGALVTSCAARFAEPGRALRQHRLAAGPHGRAPASSRRDSRASFAAGGFVGRASGRAFDARRTPGYPPYDVLMFEVPVLSEATSTRGCWIRIREVEQSLR